jgi:hypothetical protein
MKPLRRFLFILILSMILFATLSLKNTEAWSGEYLLKGKVYSNGIPVKSDSLKFIFFYGRKKVLAENISKVYTDKEGNYERKIIWNAPCPSSWIPACKGLTREQCDSLKISLENPDSIGFVYGKKQIKILNRYYDAIQYVRHGHNDFVIEQNINF